MLSRPNNAYWCVLLVVVHNQSNKNLFEDVIIVNASCKTELFKIKKKLKRPSLRQ